MTAQPHTPRDFLSVAETAELLTVSRDTVYREHKRGRITFVKVGSLTRIKRSEVERYIADNERRVA